MARVAACDEAAATALVTAVYHRLLAVLRPRISQRYAAMLSAESVADSALASFIGGIRDKDRAAPPTLEDLVCQLIRIAVNKCANRIRDLNAGKRAVDQTVALGDWDVADPAAGPEFGAELAETLEAVTADLSADERAMIDLSLAGYSVEEVAEKVGYSTRQVVRTRTKVRDRLLALVAA
jgi:DNA-directed RNA polymerase specialized sigma24 family protein